MKDRKVSSMKEVIFIMCGMGLLGAGEIIIIYHFMPPTYQKLPFGITLFVVGVLCICVGLYWPCVKSWIKPMKKVRR